MEYWRKPFHRCQEARQTGMETSESFPIVGEEQYRASCSAVCKGKATVIHDRVQVPCQFANTFSKVAIDDEDPFLILVQEHPDVATTNSLVGLPTSILEPRVWI